LAALVLMTDSQKTLTNLEALAKADEARYLIPVAGDQSQRIMLQHIAETWERIAAGIREEN
jgi:hypothetical protein